MSYYVQTVRLLKLFDHQNINVVRHFFSELQQLRGLYSIPLINAIVIMQNKGASNEYDLIEKSITYKSYMQKIRISDIRNLIVFCIRKEFNRITPTTPYVHKNEKDTLFLSIDTASSLGVNAKYLEKLVETCYYISHIYCIYEKPEVVKENEWYMYHDYVNKQSLAAAVKETYKLLAPLIFLEPTKKEKTYFEETPL